MPQYLRQVSATSYVRKNDHILKGSKVYTHGPTSIYSLKGAYTSSIRFTSQPLNWMMILWSVVPWRNASTRGAAAYLFICSTASCHCASAEQTLAKPAWAYEYQVVGLCIQQRDIHRLVHIILVFEYDSSEVRHSVGNSLWCNHVALCLLSSANLQ